MARIERASYRAGFVERLGDAGHLPAITIEVTDLPEDVLPLLDHQLLDLGGTYGDPNAGDPIQYDALRIEHEQGDVEIVIRNRAILLFTTDDEAERQVHRVCWRLDDIAPAQGCGGVRLRFLPRRLPDGERQPRKHARSILLPNP